MELEKSLHHSSPWARFFQLWAVLYIFVFMLTSQFGFHFVFIENGTSWFGRFFLHVSDVSKIKNTGSGDTSYDYVLILESLIFTCFLAILIMIADRRRQSYRQLCLFTIVIARYYVAYTMLNYGFAKIFNGQFPVNGYRRLEEKVGDMSPMGMVWTFMGASRSYTFISGLLECTGGVLLLFRKIKTFGALFALTVMTNVALLNYNYDVPVKIFSTHIVLLCLFILSYDMKPLYLFFVRQKTVSLNYNRLQVRKKWMLILLRVIKVLLIAYILYANISGLWGTLNKKPLPMAGVYTIHSFVVGGDTVVSSGLAKDSMTWMKFFIDYPGGISIQDNRGEQSWIATDIDTSRRTFRLRSDDPTNMGLLHYSVFKDTVFFDGNIHTVPVKIISTRKLKKDYSLPSRGFHWINTYPPNW